MVDKHMGVAEVKRNFADVVGEVVHGNKRIIVERRGHPVVAIVPLEAEKSASPGRRLAAAIGCGGKAGEEFRGLMRKVVASRRKRRPRAIGKDSA